jgi:hypothetical protein
MLRVGQVLRRLLGMWLVAQRERGHIPVNPNVFPASFLSSLRYLDKAKDGSQNTTILTPVFV